MSKDYHGEVTKFSELSWFRRTVKQSKLAEQWKEAHWVGKLKRADEHLLAIKGSTHSARAGRRKSRDEQWYLDSVKEVLSCSWELELSTELDTSVVRLKYITTQVWTKTGVRHFAQSAPWIQERIHLSAEHDFRSFGPQSLLKQKLQGRVADSIPSGPDVERN